MITMKSKLNIPYPCGSKMYQRALKVIHLHSKTSFDQLPEIVKTNLAKEAEAKQEKPRADEVEQDKPRADEVERLAEACEEIGWQLANANRRLKEAAEMLAKMKKEN